MGSLLLFFKIANVAPLQFVEVFRKDSFSDPKVFSLIINNLPASLPSSVSCSFYADDLVIRSSSPLVLAAEEAIQGALIRALV